MPERSADGDLDTLLFYLRDQRGFDFTGYKRASLSRRIARRMQAVGADSYSAYLNRLEANPGEFEALFNTILINVTGFMRDREAWEYLTRAVISELLGAKQSGEPIRVWSAGCSSGEEAYTLAVLLAEAVGDEGFRQTVKI
jgi:two-component system CheB/CheR fusion protein